MFTVKDWSNWVSWHIDKYFAPQLHELKAKKKNISIYQRFLEIKLCKDVPLNTAYIMFDASCKHILRMALLRLLHLELTALQEIRHIVYAQKAGPCLKYSWGMPDNMHVWFLMPTRPISGSSNCLKSQTCHVPNIRLQRFSTLCGEIAKQSPKSHNYGNKISRFAYVWQSQAHFSCMFLPVHPFCMITEYHNNR